MNIHLLLDNLSNPALLFYLLGIIAVKLKSDLEIPENTSKFLSIYLLFAIGFKGGQELAHSDFTIQIIWALVLGVFSSIVIPIYSFIILSKKVGATNASAIAACYGSVSVVTFVTAITFLEGLDMTYNGHMVAVMAFMEIPSIIVGFILMKLYSSSSKNHVKLSETIFRSFTNSSVLLIFGCLIIGLLASDKQALEIKPFTTDIFKGFLAIFLLDKGIQSAKKLSDFSKAGWQLVVFPILAPLINGVGMAYLSCYFIDSTSDRFLLAVLASSASYIAVPAAFKLIAPDANQGLYIPMALVVTFPFNITLGMPIYYWITQCI